MTDLERFRVYARTMATAQHTPTCRGHAPSRWGWAREVHPDPKCPGCVSDDDRALWARLADEIDAYLADVTKPAPRPPRLLDRLLRRRTA